MRGMPWIAPSPKGRRKVAQGERSERWDRVYPGPDGDVAQQAAAKQVGGTLAARTLTRLYEPPLNGMALSYQLCATGAADAIGPPARPCGPRLNKRGPRTPCLNTEP